MDGDAVDFSERAKQRASFFATVPHTSASLIGGPRRRRKPRYDDGEMNTGVDVHVAPERPQRKASSNDLSVVAQLVEAARRARDGDREATRAHIAHAVKLLVGNAEHRTECHTCAVYGREASLTRGSSGVAVTPDHCAHRSQSFQGDPRPRACPARRSQREPLLPCVQTHVWSVAPRLCAAPAHRISTGSHADHARAAELDRSQMRYVRSGAFHARLPSHRGRNSALVAPHQQ